jgi:hypothetical protein
MKRVEMDFLILNRNLQRKLKVHEVLEKIEQSGFQGKYPEIQIVSVTKMSRWLSFVLDVSEESPHGEWYPSSDVFWRNVFGGFITSLFNFDIIFRDDHVLAEAEETLLFKGVGEQ